MVSYLQKVPNDVLTHIAFLSASSSIFYPPTDVFHLSLSSRDMYDTLSIQSCPHLYAKLYSICFDTAAIRRRFRSPHMLTSSALCSEFVQRCRVLRRVRRGDISSQDLAQDLLTVYMMILESDGLNEMQLAVSGFPQYIAMLVQARLPHLEATNALTNETDSLAVWLLWLTLSREIITSQGIRERDKMLNLLHLFALSRFKHCSVTIPRSLSGAGPGQTSPGVPSSSLADEPVISGFPSDRKVIHYAQQLAPAWPNISLASVILIFAFNEARTLQIPRHLPPTRAVADATQQLGPTAEDYRATAGYRTFVVGNTSPFPTCDYASILDWVDGSRSRAHDQDFSRMAQILDPHHDVFRSDVPAYVPGALSGLWEGTWMQASRGDPLGLSSSSVMPSFLCRQPMQCFLREHLCFSPNMPLPRGECSIVRDEIWSINPHQLTETDEGFDLETHVPRSCRQFCYERLPKWSSIAQRDQREALDVVITGETLPEHDKAWGAYRFAGRVRLQDGLIVLKREPKSDGDDGLGTWFFEGYLHSDRCLTGRWYSSKVPNHTSVEGIFGMTKDDKGRN